MVQATVYFPAKGVHRQVLKSGPYPCFAKRGREGTVGADTPQQEYMPPLEQVEVGLQRVVVVAGSYCTRSGGYDQASLVVSLVYLGKRWKQNQPTVSHYL